MNHFIRERLQDAELLAQLAEETAELGKAALKLRRVLDGKNPTPVSMKEAFDNFEEEIADVLLCLEVLGYDLKEVGLYKAFMDVKRERWVRRLQEAETWAKTDT